MAEKEVHKTTVKKAVRRTTTKVAPRKTAARKTAATVVRKAPARESAFQTARSGRSPKTTIIVLAVFVVIFGISFAIGYSDRGVIDVSSKITERKLQGTLEEQERLRTVPVQQTQASSPNGGLVGTGKSEPVVVPQGPASTTASTTDEVASTTTSSTVPEDTVEEEGSATETPPSEPATAQ